MTTLDLDKVCDLLKERNIPAYVEQTGGGCATIYAGEPDRTDPQWPRYKALAGPGWFEGPGWSNGRADTSDFYVGPDDDGEGGYVISQADWTEADAAEAIAKQVNA